jgi:heme/copper-type cytochrome/quinol oxidase subunit 4
MTMTTRSDPRRDTRLLLLNLAVLLALTAGSFWIADVDVAPHAATAGVVLGIAVLKAHLVAGIFMEMLQAPRAWAIVMSVFLLSLTGLILAFF